MYEHIPISCGKLLVRKICFVANNSLIIRKIKPEKNCQILPKTFSYIIIHFWYWIHIQTNRTSFRFNIYSAYYILCLCVRSSEFSILSFSSFYSNHWLLPLSAFGVLPPASERIPRILGNVPRNSQVFGLFQLYRNICRF